MADIKEEAPVINMAGKENKPTYEQLQKQLFQTVEQCKNLYAQLQQANLFNTYKQLDYNFKVVELSDKFDPEFVAVCKNDIVKIMNPQPEENTNKEGE